MHEGGHQDTYTTLKELKASSAVDVYLVTMAAPVLAAAAPALDKKTKLKYNNHTMLHLHSVSKPAT